jgi:hypothetical protein
MSVILDALHKARGDKGHAAAQPHEQTVARVVDAGLAPQNTFTTAPARSGGRGWLIAMGVACGLICLVALVGGAFFLLYDQMRRIETVAAKPAATVPAGADTSPATIAVPQTAALQPTAAMVTPAAVLQTPVPLAELPVQAPAAAAAVDPGFSLGSIVCENSDCIASLNGRSVRVGDTIKGYKVTKIESSSIALKNESTGAEKTLSLFD